MDYRGNDGYLLDFGDLRNQINSNAGVFSGYNNGHYDDCDSTPKLCGIDYPSCQNEVTGLSISNSYGHSITEEPDMCTCNPG